MRKILLTNDDGIYSPALKSLWSSLIKISDVEIVTVVPEHEMSAAGKSITLHKPLRINKVVSKLQKGKYYTAYLVSGTPADAVVVALKFIVGEKPLITVSGINLGDNITIDNIFTSGTVAAAIQSALQGIKAVSMSSAIPSDFRSRSKLFSHFLAHGAISTKIVDFLLNNGFPSGVDLININFPFSLSSQTPVRITSLGRTKFENFILERVDPRGTTYYWIGGNQINIDQNYVGTDLYALAIENAISITPIRLDLTATLELNEERIEREKKAAEEIRVKMFALKDAIEQEIKKL
ncbi:MAG: 5'/3'-nucleotidase SurE [Thermoproteota archaeon]|nr:5'/3'-nucleotidase SurE [Candidatus Brockarchaeota archaeon]